MPWTLLSAGVAFEEVRQRVRIALDNGASGYRRTTPIGGEAVTLVGDERVAFLAETAVPRLAALCSLLTEHGRPWREAAAWYSHRTGARPAGPSQTRLSEEQGRTPNGRWGSFRHRIGTANDEVRSGNPAGRDSVSTTQHRDRRGHHRRRRLRSRIASLAQRAANKNITLMVGVKGDPFYVSMQCGAQAAAKKLGYKLQVQGPDKFDATLQNPLLDAVASAKPAALLVAPNDVKASAPPLKRIQAGGTKVVLVDTIVTDKSVGVSRIATDNQLGGGRPREALAHLGVRARCSSSPPTRVSPASTRASRASARRPPRSA